MSKAVEYFWNFHNPDNMDRHAINLINDLDKRNDKLVEVLTDIREELDEDHIHDREDCTGDCPVCKIDEVLEGEQK